MKKIIVLFMLVSLSSLAEGQSDNNSVKQRNGDQSNISKGSGNQNVQYCNMPKEIIVKNICKPVIKEKIVYKKRKQKIVVKEKIIVKKVIKVVNRPMLKNSLRLLGGYGPTGVSAEQVGSKAIAFTEDGAIFGLGYTRRLNRRLSVEGSILNNGTYLLGVGFNF